MGRVHKSIQNDVVLFMTTYPPRQCGIATYCQDLVQSMTQRFGESFSVQVCALESEPLNHVYPPEVTHVLEINKPGAYQNLAREINSEAHISTVWIQHEFGLFNGDYGVNLMEFLSHINKPVVITFHSVLPDPEPGRMTVVRSIAQHVEAITVMTEHSKKLLVSEYDVPESKITVIRHGTHPVMWQNKDLIKKQYGLQSRLVLSTFGFLSPNKSIETALYALPAIKAEFPNVIYYILGKTHPNEVSNHGEQYRESLEKIIRELGLEDDVHFVNRFMKLTELLDFLRVTDVYLFTSKDPNQAVSGTFSYAMGCGCAIVSTRIPHAVEMLEEGAGILVDFNNPDAFADATRTLLRDKSIRERAGIRAWELTRASSWNNVAYAHVQALRGFLSTRKVRFSIPAISLDHLNRLTDSRGIIQFSKISEPDPQSGYTLDDNARALIAISMHYTLMHHKHDLNLMGVYLNFIKHCQCEDGSFLNYIDWNGGHSEMNNYTNLQDSNGRALWALGYFLSLDRDLPVAYISHANAMFRKAIPRIHEYTSPRAMSFAIKGLFYFHRHSADDSVLEIVRTLADRMLEGYASISDEDWQWFEPYMTYANAVLPEAMMYAYLLIGKPTYLQVAQTSFDFLLSMTIQNRKIRVISNRGWLQNGSSPFEFGEQPIDVAYTMMTLDLFWKVYQKPEYRLNMDIVFEWFLGRNHLSQMIYNSASGGCHDGLEETNVNLNQGAESTVCYLIARMIMERVRRDEIRRARHHIPSDERTRHVRSRAS